MVGVGIVAMLVSAYVLYWVVRCAVRDGIRDTQQSRDRDDS